MEAQPGLDPSQGSADTPMPPDVLDSLRGRMAGAEAQREQLDTQHRLSLNQIEDLKRELMGDVFSAMKSQGVDPSSPESVQEFLQSLEDESPDLARLFEFFFNVLAPEDAAGASPEMGGAQGAGQMPADDSAGELVSALDGGSQAPGPAVSPEVEPDPLETEGSPIGTFLGE